VKAEATRSLGPPQAAPAARLRPMGTISVIIPALNEEGNLGGTLEAVTSVVESLFREYEVIVVNDGSRDGTLRIAESWAHRNPRIRVVSHPSPRGFGYSYHSGRRLVTKEHCVMIHGDNAFSRQTLSHFLSHAGKADVICGYIANPESRSWLRRIVSSAYTGLLNALFARRLRYYNGLQIHSTEWLRTMPLESVGFGFQAELLLWAIRTRKRILQVPTWHQERPGGGATKIFKWRNIISVLGTLLRLRFGIPVSR